ncbi:PREDICTED: two-component response regulator-like PRR37 [Camelina sativa]|uniref:Two-component response regulator-like PRR37 n=1 Tax=Camelina sativa TaxID=90675 RepID=A0ABM0UNL0_CAMSA|nr:PREDICTED: two-component response regulator-like PRR37 [Camelina sativa]
MCGHISSSITSGHNCPCFLYSENIVTPPLLHDDDHYHHHQFQPPTPLPLLMMSHNSLFSAEAVSGFGYFDSCMNGGGGSSSCDSPSSMGSGGESLAMQRSVSSHNGFSGNFAPAHDYVNDDDGPVRRALSAGDLPRISRRESSAVWSESNAIIEGMSKAYKYSPEEKKEKIEKYRSKRNLRNFNKRIKYECRKTLADSRPRIRGRFARNDEMSQQEQVDVMEAVVGDVDTWASFLDSFTANHFLN